MPSSARTATTSVADDLLSVSVRPGEAGHVVVGITGELDLGNADHAGKVLSEQLARGHRFVTLDLTDLTFVNSAGLRMIALAHNEFLVAGGALVLAGVGPRTARLLAVTHLDTALFFADGPSGQLPPRHLTSVDSMTPPRR